MTRQPQRRKPRQTASGRRQRPPDGKDDAEPEPATAFAGVALRVFAEMLGSALFGKRARRHFDDF